MKQIDGLPHGTRAEVEALYEQIEKIANAGDKFFTRREDTTYETELAALRKLYRDWGLKGISVTRAKGAMCYWPVVRVPRINPDEYNRATGLEDWDKHDDAVRLLEEATLRVYPKFSTIYPDNPYQDGCTIRCTFS